MEVFGIIARVAVGAVLLFSGYGKIRSRRWPMLAVEAGIPRFVVLTLPAFELILGLLLVGQLAHGFFGWVSVALFTAFLVVVSVQLATGKKAPCNCFGGDGESVIGWMTIARNIMFVVVALMGALL